MVMSIGYIIGAYVLLIPFIEEHTSSKWSSIVGVTSSNESQHYSTLVLYVSNILIYFNLLMYYKSRKGHLKQKQYKFNHLQTIQETNGRRPVFDYRNESSTIKHMIKARDQTTNSAKNSTESSRRVKKVSTFQKLKTQLTFIFSYPFAHVFILGFLLFVWMFRYTCYQSLFILVWLVNTLMFKNSDWFFNMCKYIYIPILFAYFIFFYTINITNLFSPELYEQKYHRYGMYEFEYVYLDLIFQMFTFFYACLVCRLYAIYKVRMEDQALKNLLTTKATFAKRNRLVSSDDKNDILDDSDKEVKLYEIILANVLKYLDVVLLVCLYITGTNRVDIFHIILLIYLTFFIVYPKFMRRKFVYFLSFVMLVVTFKYVYVLISYEIYQDYILYKTLYVLGLVNDFNEEDKYWRAALINDNWLIVFLAVVQYQLYKSKLLGWIFMETGKADENVQDIQSSYTNKQFQKFYELNKSILLYIQYPKLSRAYIY